MTKTGMFFENVFEGTIAPFLTQIDSLGQIFLLKDMLHLMQNC